jgi:hypothetical protein
MQTRNEIQVVGVSTQSLPSLFRVIAIHPGARPKTVKWRPVWRIAGRHLNATIAFGLAVAALLLTAGQGRAIELLGNTSFEGNGGHAIPVNWTRYAPPPAAIFQPFGNYWVENNPPVPHTGLQYWKQWGACYDGTNNVATLYQVSSSLPGSIYQASGWFYTFGGDATHNPDILGADCSAWIQVSFLNSSSNLLALYKSTPFTANAGVSTWLQYQVTNACDLSQPVSLGDPFFTTYAVTGSVSQLVAPLGTARVRYEFCYLQATNEGGSCYFDDASLNQISGPVPPMISNLFPLNMIFVPPTNGIHFNVSSPSGFTINNGSIHLIVNGVDVSGSLTISGSSSNKNVTYSGLQSNLTYTASITATDTFNLTAAANTYFETTWVGTPRVIYLWEAEDWDFTNGMSIDNPDICNAPGDPNCYFGKVGTQTVDELSFLDNGAHLYRADDLMCTGASGDYTRPNLAAAGRLDYCINPFVGSPGGASEWINYTRTNWPTGTFWIIGRLATALSGSVSLSVVNPDTSTTQLGTFTINNGPGWTTYQNVFLRDTNGNIVNVTLGGKATLQVTSGGNLLPTFFALVAATPDQPIISNLYPTGTRPFEYTNALSFAVSSTGATLPTTGIKLTLDGVDVSAGLVITGPVSARNVVYPSLMPNAMHTAIITVTNSLGHGILVSNRFDTFNETNYSFEAEDFDYGGGQYIANWVPDAYADYNGPFPAVTNIDFQHTSLDGEVFSYRTGGIPQDGLNGDDYLRSVFVDNGAIDYVLVFFAGGDWANYTRNYPTGNYYAYMRTSGSGPFTMYLDQVVSGAGTTSQTTRRLGTWSAVGLNYTTFNWVPLTDAGLVAPVLVKLNGVSTLRITTAGDCNPNFVMFVPTSGITVSATRSAGTIAISFPTQAGANYRVFYRTSLSSGNWVLLATVIGNGGVQQVTDSTAGGTRYYEVVAP